MPENLQSLENYLAALESQARSKRANHLRAAAICVEACDGEAEKARLSVAEQALQDIALFSAAGKKFEGFQSEVVNGVSAWFDNHGVPFPKDSRVVLTIDIGQQVEEAGSSKKLSPEEEEAKRRNMDLIRENLGNLGAFEYLGPQLDTPLDDLDLSIRTYNALVRGGRVRDVRGILGYREEDLLGVNNFGKKCFEETLSSLADRGYLPLPGFVPNSESVESEFGQNQ